MNSNINTTCPPLYVTNTIQYNIISVFNRTGYPDLSAYFPSVSVGEVIYSHLQYPSDIRQDLIGANGLRNVGHGRLKLGNNLIG